MKEITDRRFPIGKFEYGKSYSIEDTRKHIKTIARLPKDLKKVIKKLRDGALERSYRAGGWTARQVINHLADSNMNAYIRFKLAATETAPIIKPYEETLWAETDDAKYGSPKTSLKLLSALHVRWVNFLMSLSEDDLDLGYYHPANKRTVTLREAIALYAWHCKHHLAHLTMVAEGNIEKVAEATKTKAAKAVKSIEKASETPTTPKRVMSEDHKGKIKAAQQARRAAEKASKPAEKTASISDAPKKRGRKPGIKPAAIAAELVPAKRGRKPNPALATAKAEAAAKTEKGKPGRKPNPEIAAAKVAKAAKVAASKLARAEMKEQAKAAATEKKAVSAKLKSDRSSAAIPKIAAEKGKPGRKPNPAVAAAKAAKAAEPKLSRAEVMEKARAAAAVNRAAKAANAPKKIEPEKSTRVRRSAEEVAAEKLAKANMPKLSRAEVMEKARAAAAANRAAKGEPAKPKKDPNAPKLSRAEVMEKARAARAGKKK